MNFLSMIIGIATLSFLSAPLAAKSSSITGVWSAPGGSCKTTDGLTTIKAMSLRNDDVVCLFRSVKRTGETVIWRGTCDGAEGSTQQVVTATEKNGKLTIAYSPGGNVINDMVRCPRL
jgi:hypothetical protein